MSSSHVAFTGPFADINFGDYAMLVNNVADINPDSFTLFSYDTPFLETVREYYFPNQDVDVVTVSFHDSFVERLITGYVPTPFEVVASLQNLDAIRSSLSRTDTLVVNGGGYLNGLWARPHRIDRLMRILAPAMVASQMGVRTVITGNGVGPYFGYDDLFGTIFQSLGTVTYNVRDRFYSAANLRRAGIADAQIANVPDDLFLINESLTRAPRRPLELPDRYVVLETYLPIEELADSRDSFATFAKQMRDRGLTVVFLPFNLGNGGVEQGLYLESVVDGLWQYDIGSNGFLPIEDALDIIGRAEFVVSTRYHALVLALRCGTPVVNALRDVMGDKRYYYGKAVGALETALPGPIDPGLYMAGSYTDALEKVLSEFDSLRSLQLQHYAEYLPNAVKTSARARSALVRSILR